MKLILVWLVVFCSCTYEPSPGAIYRCEGFFVCYGDHFGLVPETGYYESLEDAECEYLNSAIKLTQEAKCGSSWEVFITCTEE